MRWAAPVCFLLLTSAIAFAALGIFRGQLVEPPPQQSRAGWIFVQSPRGTLRQVEISKAKISYSDEVPTAGRASSPAADLVPGAEVLVTAEMSEAGEWRATEVQILALRSGRAGTPSRPRRLARAR